VLSAIGVLVGIRCQNCNQIPPLDTQIANQRVYSRVYVPTSIRPLPASPQRMLDSADPPERMQLTTRKVFTFIMLLGIQNPSWTELIANEMLGNS
jgi:hypothetical protein